MEGDLVCSKCKSEHVYADGHLMICPECGHEWNPAVSQKSATSQSEDSIIRDAFGTELADGDSVTVIKDLKIKGSTSVVKVGTKVKNIRLLAEAADDHNIACKVDGVGAVNLKSQFVKRS